MPKQESPLVSFRIPLPVIDQLIKAQQISENYTKSELSSLVKAVFLEQFGASYQVSINSEFLHDLADNAIEAKQVAEALEGRVKLLQEQLSNYFETEEESLALELSKLADKFTRLRLRKDYQELADHTRLKESQEFLLNAIAKLHQR